MRYLKRSVWKPSKCLREVVSSEELQIQVLAENRDFLNTGYGWSATRGEGPQKIKFRSRFRHARTFLAEFHA
jgi:hypothetical protein